MDQQDVVLYADAFETLRDFVPDALVLFADKWSRWPDERGAGEIVRLINRNILTFERLRMLDVVNKLKAVRAAILKRAAIVEAGFYERDY
jgi:hypothetical protein